MTASSADTAPVWDGPGTDEFEAKVAALVAKRRARAAPYEAELRQHDSYPDVYGVVIGMIRGLDYRTPRMDDAAYRDEVTAILDAHERLTEQRIAEWKAQS